MSDLGKKLGLRIAPDYTSLLIPQNVEIPKPKSVFNIAGIAMFTLKSISLGIAKAKAGKTTAVAWIVANMLKNGIKVLWIDTEQGDYYGSRTQHWILSIAFLDSSENLKYFDLRTLTPVERVEAIEQYLNTYEIDVVVIDGVRDLVSDINNPDQATECTSHLMRWSEVFNCHIISILHQNKGDNNARGHLGSELLNKSETVFKVETDEQKQLIISSEFSRGEPFEPFALGRSDKGIPFLLDDWASLGTENTGRRKTKKLPEIIDASLHMMALKKTFATDSKMNATNFYGDFVIAYNDVFSDVENDKMTGNRARGFLEYYIKEDYVTVEKGERNNEKIYAINSDKVSDQIY